LRNNGNGSKLIVALSEEVKVFRSIDEIGKTAVDSLAVDGFFTYGWFKAIETQSSVKMTPIYIAVYNGGKVVAIAPCFVDSIGDFFSYGPKLTPYFHRIVSLGQKLRFYDSHALLCCSPFCFRSKLLFEDNLDEKHILSLLASKLDLVCKEKRFLFSAFLFVSEFDELLRENLQHHGYEEFRSITTYYLEVKWSSFEDYLKSLKKRTERKVRREMREFERQHVVEDQAEFGESSDRLSKLASNLVSKYSESQQESMFASLFLKLSEHASDKAKLFVAKKNNELVGFSLSLRHNDVLDVWMTGFDYDVQSKTDFAYFNLCFYMPIQWAISEGITKIYYRWKSEGAKVKRGCVPETNYAFVKCNNRLLSILISSVLKSRLYSHLKTKYLK
jgi:predicted N-acyltransferase